ncbi:MAG TPA: NAD(+)/NADH kinase, partial [Rhabdochlamydiaceae bacterium]|nr:NAD(+)/NADH kinase [Rhabdochlamydiaceae bacterium]
MMIAIFPSSKKESRELAKEIQKFLSQRKVTVIAENEDAEEIGATPMSEINPLEIDFLLSMGGDGTILRLVHKYEHLKAAVLGINLGH